MQEWSITYWLGGLNSDLGLEESVLDVDGERERVAVWNCSQTANLNVALVCHFDHDFIISVFLLDSKPAESEVRRMLRKYLQIAKKIVDIKPISDSTLQSSLQQVEFNLRNATTQAVYLNRTVSIDAAGRSAICAFPLAST